jgi:hypothetical protein
MSAPERESILNSEYHILRKSGVAAFNRNRSASHHIIAKHQDIHSGA